MVVIRLQLHLISRRTILFGVLFLNSSQLTTNHVDTTKETEGPLIFVAKAVSLEVCHPKVGTTQQLHLGVRT